MAAMVDERPAKLCPMCQHAAHDKKKCDSETVFMTRKVHCQCDYEEND